MRTVATYNAAEANQWGHRLARPRYNVIDCWSPVILVIRKHRHA